MLGAILSPRNINHCREYYMIIISRLLMICMFFSYTFMSADTDLNTQETITKSRRGPSTANKFFGVLKKASNAIFVLGIGATLFCGYIWLIHEVNSPERMKEMTEKQERIKQALDQLQTPRDQLRAFPQMLIWGQLEFFKNIDVGALISAMTASFGGAAYLLFSGAQALT